MLKSVINEATVMPAAIAAEQTVANPDLRGQSRRGCQRTVMHRQTQEERRYSIKLIVGLARYCHAFLKSARPAPSRSATLPADGVKRKIEPPLGQITQTGNAAHRDLPGRVFSA